MFRAPARHRVSSCSRSPPCARRPEASRCVVPREARAVDTSDPDRWVGDGTPASCTSRAVVRAVAKGGIIRFRCGPDPVTIELRRTAKVVNTSKRVVIDGGGLVTLSGDGERRILYQNTCDPKQTWTTDHCDDQATPRLVVQHLTLATATRPARPTRAVAAARSSRAAAGSRSWTPRFLDNRCDKTGPDLGGAAVRALSQHHGRPVYVVEQHVHRWPVQQRLGAEQHRRLVGGLQQHVHRQPGDRPRRQPGAARHAGGRLRRRDLRRRQRLHRAHRRLHDDRQPRPRGWRRDLLRQQRPHRRPADPVLAG